MKTFIFLIVLLCGLFVVTAAGCRRVSEESVPIEIVNGSAAKELPEPETEPPVAEPAVEEPVVELPVAPEPAPLPRPAPASGKGDYRAGLSITAPRDGDIYGPFVYVEGRVNVTGNPAVDADLYREAVWEVLGTSLGGALEPDAAGRFRFSFPTDTLSGSVQLKVQAIFAEVGVTECVVSLRDSDTGPVVEILEPADNSIYTSDILIRGRVYDGATPGRTEGIKTLVYSIPGTDRTGEVSFGRTGEFGFYLDTSGLSGSLVVEMKSEDHRGRTGFSTVTLTDDPSGPWIEISSPADGSFYSSEMTIRGRVADSPDRRGSIKEIAGVSWILGDRGGDIDIGTGGAFSFPIETTGLPKQSILIVRATDKNGHAGESMLLLRDDGVGPFLSITSPRDGEALGEKIELIGSVVNRESSRSTEGEVLSLKWSVMEYPGTGGAIEFGNDGSFRTGIPTDGLAGDITMELSASDRHGNISKKYLRLFPASDETDQEKALEIILSDNTGIVDYRSAALVSGNITGMKRKDVRSLSWNIRDTDRKGTIPVDSDGAFTLRLDTGGLDGSLALFLQADTGGVRAVKTVLLEESSLFPDLNITSPASGDVFRSSVTVSGRVSDRPGKLSLDELDSLEWSIPGTDRHGVISPGADGAFRIDVSTEGLHEDIFLNIAARDTIGHLTEEHILLRDDGTGPYIAFSSPPADSYYPVSVVCTGYIRDDRAPASGTGEVASARWSIRGSRLSGPITPAADGTFTFSFSGLGLSDSAIVEVSALDRNGHQTQKTLTLRKNPVGPYMKIESPEDLGYYRDQVKVAGRVMDRESAHPSIEELKTVSWRIVESDRDAGYVYVEQNGDFSFSLDTDKMHGPLQILVTAENLFGVTTDMTVRLIDGKEPPGINLTSPADNAPYGAGISIEGYIVDPYGNDPEYGGIDRVEYEMLSARFSRETEMLKGAISPGSDGSFYHPLNTLALRDDQNLILRVFARNGNSTEKTILLTAGSSGIPSFTLKPGDRQVTALWNALPFADSYSLRYIRGGSDSMDRSASSAGRIRPPYVLSRLENGFLYSLILDGVIQGTTVSSDIIEVIPLSEYTLRPSLKGEFQQITAQWRDIPAADRYILYRAEKVPEEFSILTTVEGNSYIDTDVQFGTEYYYRVAPAEVMAPVSAYTMATSLATPPSRVTVTATESAYTPYGVTVVGDYAYIPAGDKGLRILDISVPVRNFERGFCDTADARAVEVIDEFAYLADGAKGLKIININDPQNPIIVGSRNTQSALDIDVEGNYAYIADGVGGFKILDVKDVNSPQRVSSLALDNALSCVVADNKAYIAAGQGGVRIIDISSPREPREMGVYFTSDARDLCLENGLLFVADPEEGLIILDPANPEHPSLQGSLRIPGARAVTVKNNYVFLAAGDRGLVVVDALDPTRPGIFDETDSTNALSLALKDEFVLLADARGLAVIRTYLFGTSFRIAGLSLDGNTSRITMSGNSAFVASRSGGLHVVDIARPEGVNEKNRTMTISSDSVEGSVAYGDYLVILNGEDGAAIYGKPWNGEPVHVELSGSAVDGALSGSRLYLALSSGGLGVLELSGLPRGEAPVLVERIPLDNVRAVEAGRTLVLAADRRKGVVFFTVGDRGLKEAGSLPLDGVRDIALQGETAAVVGSKGLTLIDVRDPVKPVLLGTYATRFAESVVFRNNLLYLSEGYRGLTVLRVSDEGIPQRVSVCPTIYAVDSAVSGEYAFVSDGEGLSVVKVIVPSWLTDGGRN